ncbi:hypothetical protein M1N56_06270 [Dehalococcoidia bacterium]|nr:hypothetical protein [Dehalococcoidia bacterium]
MTEKIRRRYRERYARRRMSCAKDLAQDEKEPATPKDELSEDPSPSLIDDVTNEVLELSDIESVEAVDGILSGAVEGDPLIFDDTESFTQCKEAIAGFYSLNESPAAGIGFMLMTLLQEFRHGMGVRASFLYEKRIRLHGINPSNIPVDLAKAIDELTQVVHTVFSILGNGDYGNQLREGSLKDSIQREIRSSDVKEIILRHTSHGAIEGLTDEVLNDFPGVINREKIMLKELENDVQRIYWSDLILRVYSLLDSIDVASSDYYGALGIITVSRAIRGYFRGYPDPFKPQT